MKDFPLSRVCVLQLNLLSPQKTCRVLAPVPLICSLGLWVFQACLVPSHAREFCPSLTGMRCQHWIACTRFWCIPVQCLYWWHICWPSTCTYHIWDSLHANTPSISTPCNRPENRTTAIIASLSSLQKPGRWQGVVASSVLHVVGLLVVSSNWSEGLGVWQVVVRIE